MKINLNTIVSVKLTAIGAQRYDSIYGLFLRSTPIKPGEELRCELWRLMADFGPTLTLSSLSPFEDNKLELPDIYKENNCAT